MAGIPTSRGDMLTKSHQSGRFVVRAFVALWRQLRKRAGMVNGGALGGGSLITRQTPPHASLFMSLSI